MYKSLTVHHMDGQLKRDNKSTERQESQQDSIVEHGGESYCRQGAPLINDSTEQHLSPPGDNMNVRIISPASSQSQGPSTQAPGNKDSNQEFDKLVLSLRN